MSIKPYTHTFKEDQGKICFCIGPQNGEPKCPCEMKGLIQRDGRWIQPEVDLGPVSIEALKEQSDEWSV